MVDSLLWRPSLTSETSVFAHSPLGIPILAHRFGSGPVRVLILGGVHGDETEGVACALGLHAEFLKLQSAGHFYPRLSITLIPQFNVDGVLARTRTNSTGVDLNRNLPTKDWSPEIATPRYHPGSRPNSEPENQALSSWIEEFQPHFVLSLHSWNPMLNINGDCRAEAEILNQHTGYSIEESIGYPTPGSLGTYSGIERNCPTLTYEIQRGLPLNEVLRIHVPAILHALKATEKRNV